VRNEDARIYRHAPDTSIPARCRGFTGTLLKRSQVASVRVLGASKQTGVHLVVQLDIGMDYTRDVFHVVFDIPISASWDLIEIPMEKVVTYVVNLVHYAHRFFSIT
jgi:hypothetical protein